jgi:tetratricopeptide (TPR) repeat protein/transglutaminase-like putative cysteine protease
VLERRCLAFVRTEPREVAVTRKLAVLPVAAFVLGSALLLEARADTITLRDGTVLEGKIVEDTGSELVIETSSGKQKIQKASALSVVRDSGSAPTVTAPLPPTPPERTAPPDGGGKKIVSTRGSESIVVNDWLPEATALEREGLALEGQGDFRGAMEKFEAALKTAATAGMLKGAEELPNAKEELEKARGARVEVLVRRCSFFWNKLGEHVRGARLTADGGSGFPITPHAQDVMLWYHVQEQRALGNADAANGFLGKLNFTTQWYVVGPFDNERGTGFGNEYDPETQPFDPKAHFKGKERQVAWRPVPVEHPFYGEVDLFAMLRPNLQTLAYAITYLHADADTKAVLRIGSDEALKVWVNRTLVDSEDSRRPLGFDQSHVGVTLKKGWNEVLLKVCNQTGPWAFRCRVTAPEGGPVAGVRWATSDEIAKTQEFAKGAEKFDADTGAIGYYEARRKADPKDAWARFHLGYLYYSEKPHDENEHKDRAALDEACKLEPNNPYFQVFYSHTAAANAEFSVNKEENKRRTALERALEIKPDYAQAALLLSNYYLESLANRTRGRELTAQALKANPAFLDAELLHLQLEDNQGLQPIVARRLRELDKTPEAKTYAPLIRRLIHEDALRGRAHEHWGRLDDLLALNKADAGPLLEQAQMAHGMGRLDLSTKLLEKALALAPWNTQIRVSLASTREAAGDLPGAEAALRDALVIAPEDDGLLQRLGHLLEREGKEEDGQKVLAQALEVNPKLPDLKKYFEYLERKKASGVAPWEDAHVLEATKILDEAKALPLDETLVSRLLLRNTVVKVNEDGTSSTFTQEIERVENEEGTRQLVTNSVGYHPGEQKATYRRARVYRKGDPSNFEDMQVSETSGFGGGGGEFTGYAGHSVELGTLEIGDVIETWSRVDDLKQSFFGDYFGADEKFAEFGKPIDHIVFRVIAPSEKKLFEHKTGLDDVPVVETTTDDPAHPGKSIRTRTWAKNGIAKVEPEPRMPWAQEILPKVQVSTFGDWNTFSKWYWGLVKQQQEADDEIKSKVAELTKDCKTEEEKIRKIYNFVVTDIRYDSAWEFGVHGFKPYNATSIFKRKFGDCKDKATLIDTMLSVVGIEAHPVLIFGANPRGNEDLALPLMHHFNHCISYVPGAKDGKGMWLDGTAQYHPFDTLPTMDYGATTLIVYPDRGELKTIPFRGPEANEEREKHTVQLDSGGGAVVHSTFEGSGDFNWFLRGQLVTKGRRAEILEKAIGKFYTGAKVKKVECSDLEDLDKPARVDVEVGMPKLLQKSTGGLALDEVRSWLFDWIYLGQEKISALAAKDKRDFDVVLEVPSGVEEDTVYELPAGAEVKNLPVDTKLSGEFGDYSKTFKLDGGKRLHVVRKFAMKTNRIPKERYDEFRKFVGTIERAENERVILSKEGGEE